jgi:hypothetical protein
VSTGNASSGESGNAASGTRTAQSDANTSTGSDRAAGGTTAPADDPQGITVTVSLKESGNPSDLIAVSVPKALARPGSHFTFALPAHAIPATAQGGTASVAQVNGQALPSWLTFDPQSRAFTANSVPAGALPLQAVMTVGDVRVPLVIVERNQ